MFEMSEMDIQSTLASMIIEGELQAALSIPTETLVPQKAARCTALQALAYQLSDKLNLLLDTSERTVERPSRQTGQQTRQQRAVYAWFQVPNTVFCLFELLFEAFPVDGSSMQVV